MSLFKIQTKDRHTIVECPENLGTQAAKEFAEISNSLIQGGNKLIILDFAPVKALDTPMFRPFVLFYQALKPIGCYLFVINVSNDNLLTIRSSGLVDVLVAKTSINEALEAAGIKAGRPTIDVNFINPFVRATQVTLETQANTKIQIGKPYLKKEGQTFDIAIAGVISITSPAFHGSIALCFPAKVFLTIYSNLLGEKHEVITKEIEDAAGELLNIIFGQAKAELNDRSGYQIQKAIPTIVRGEAMQVHHMTRNVAVILPFEIESGSFHIEVSTDATS